MVEDREVLREVWSGRIPACFTLGSSDPLSSAGSVTVASEPADPFYIMLPRQSYLTLVTDKVQLFDLWHLAYYYSLYKVLRA